MPTKRGIDLAPGDVIHLREGSFPIVKISPEIGLPILQVWVKREHDKKRVRLGKYKEYTVD